MTATPSVTGRPNVRAVSALLAMAVGAFCFVAMETLPVGLLPLIAGDFHISLSYTGLLVTGYGLTVAIMSVPLAYVTRRIPRRVLMSALLAVFVVATLGSAVASTFTVLLLARVAVALSQSVFWAVVGPAAASLFSVEVRGRAAATVFAGSAMAPMLGVPAGTWLGQLAGWRAAFAGLAAVGLLAFVLVAALMPTRPVGQGHAATGTAPSVRRYVLLVMLTILVIAGLFASFTYTTPFLTDVAGVPTSAVSVALLIRGVIDLGGVILGGMLVDRRPHLVMIGSVALILVSLLGMWAFGSSAVATVTLLAVSGFALGSISPALTSRVLEVAPGNSDLASAGNSAAFNLGIAGGSAVGGLVLGLSGLRATALVGGLIVLVSLVLAVIDPALARADRTRRFPTAPDPASEISAGTLP
jgi:DHA1 family inner membrane transport protein